MRGSGRPLDRRARVRARRSRRGGSVCKGCARGGKAHRRKKPKRSTVTGAASAQPVRMKFPPRKTEDTCGTPEWRKRAERSPPVLPSAVAGGPPGRTCRPAAAASARSRSGRVMQRRCRAGGGSDRRDKLLEPLQTCRPASTPAYAIAPKVSSLQKIASAPAAIAVNWCCSIML